MEIFRLPDRIDTLIFDIDGTLYTDDTYVYEQQDVQIRYFAQIHSISDDAARKMVADFRTEYAASHGGKNVSLGNTFAALGIPISENIEWRKNLIAPEKFLKKDEVLARTLEGMTKNFMLVCVTNNPASVGEKTLEVLGVKNLFKGVVGLDTCNVSKPARKPFLKAVEMTETVPEFCVAIGDRYDIDIALPLEMGMGGILVKGAEDVYELPLVLAK